MQSIHRTNFYYDPYRQGYDTNEWRTLAGTVISNVNRLEVVSGAISHYFDILKGDITFNINAQTNPTSLNSIVGLYQPMKGAYVAFVFNGSLTAAVSDGTNSTSSAAITWDPNWTAQNLDFRIMWEQGLVKFYIQTTCVATIAGDYIPHGPLSLYVYDKSTIPLSIGSINVLGAHDIFVHTATSSTVAPVEPFGGVSTSSSITVTEAATIKIPILVPSVSDGVTITENYAKAIV